MKKAMKQLTLMALAGLIHSTAYADDFILSSNDIRHGEFMDNAQEFTGFGCKGGNQSPQLIWSGAPKGTQAFALLAYDPDAPTGSGWWHWQLVNIPKNVSELAAGAGTEAGKNLPAGSMQMRNDYGSHSFGGACPPPGDGAHRYQFTVYALKQKLELPKEASAALTGYMVNANALASATIEALYKRD
ncbi:YbhB/YbcL family Raf kinase inhibitor-like protein [Bacterioplanoides sp. SCSIO 12839]|uniref:YbhB/YbcL family Raf kinase inhibitor-like protein n=1 Tax=Bacterioplanoides sp. SCSIO 12839 TaxID=2829569 RepID=UPI0027295020|nr:YbhB/YbcL family Raf kinase inhibitor-like protein [Bacterioplanoides sp. SCSIO 12839]